MGSVALRALALALALAAPAGAQKGLGADFGPRRALVLDGTSAGSVRVLVASWPGQGGPLLEAPAPGRRAVLESITFLGPEAAFTRLSVDGGDPLEPVWSTFTRTRYEPELALAPGLGGTLTLAQQLSSIPWPGAGWRASLSTPTWVPPLPPFHGVIRFDPDAAPADVRQFSGFETGDLAEFTTNGGVSVQSSVVRSGGFALRSTAQEGQYAYATLLGLAPDGSGGVDLGIDDLYVSFWFRVADWSQRVRIAEVGGTGGATKLRLELEPDGRLSTEEHGLTRRFGQTVLAKDTWYRIRLRVGTGAATDVELLLNGSVEVSTQSANTSVEPTRRVHVGRAASSGGASDFYYDDVVVAAQGFPANGQVVLLSAAGPGAFDDWSGSFADVDDWPHDGDASFRAAQGSAASAFTSSLESAQFSGEVLGVKALSVVRRESGPTPSALRVVSGGVVSDTAASDTGPSYALRARVLATDPAGGTSWTWGAVDGLELGSVQLGTGSITRTTAIGAQVLFVPPGS